MTDLDLAAIEARANDTNDEPWIVVHEPAWEADGARTEAKAAWEQAERDLAEANDLAAERDDWRRRYEALRDGVTGLHFRDARGGCASCIDPDGFSVRWPCETAALVARVEGDES